MPLPHDPVLAPPAAEEHCQDALFAALHHGIDQLQPRDAERWLRTVAKRLLWTRLRADADGGDAALAAWRACLAGYRRHGKLVTISPGQQRQHCELKLN